MNPSSECDRIGGFFVCFFTDVTPWHLQPHRCLPHTSVGTWKRQQTEIGPGFIHWLIFWCLLSAGKTLWNRQRSRFGQSLLSAEENLSDKSCKCAQPSLLLDTCCLRWPQSMKPKKSWGKTTHERKIINIHSWLPFWWYWTINQEIDHQRYRQNLHSRHLWLFDGIQKVAIVMLHIDSLV